MALRARLRNSRSNDDALSRLKAGEIWAVWVIANRYASDRPETGIRARARRARAQPARTSTSTSRATRSSSSPAFPARASRRSRSARCMPKRSGATSSRCRPTRGGCSTRWRCPRSTRSTACRRPSRSSSSADRRRRGRRSAASRRCRISCACSTRAPATIRAEQPHAARRGLLAEHAGGRVSRSATVSGASTT